MAYHRKSPRASRYDYTSPWWYFITICTKNRVHYFGEIVDGVMNLHPLGVYCTDHRGHISSHYPQVVCDAFVCMPNHIHGIIIIGESVGMQLFASWNGNHSTRTDKNPSLQSAQPSCASWSLGAIMRGFKIWITTYANTHHIPFERQSRYHDHIIRNHDEYIRIKHYIQTNPENRQKDCFSSVDGY